MIFTDITLEHFRRPKFQGLRSDSQALGMSGSFETGRFAIIGLVCRDGKIEDARFRTFNCISSIASANWLCQEVCEVSLEQAREIKVQSILSALGGLPKSREFCAHLVHDAFKIALGKAQEKGVLS